ncbi:MAG TPA: hypothetical protein PKA00_10040 [Saprospiraceae bacterium]|nr:hypothetical protein [Saprospiraceae bacterium]HMQ83238.1 hypothetical protein [Saprospiraceae bacterium]
MSSVPDFQHFLHLFPEVELPFTLGEHDHHTFSMQNTPISGSIIQEYVLPIEEEDPDEFTEFVACLKIPATKDFHAIVYWKAALMDYRYVLATFNKKGVLIDKLVIAGTFYQDKALTSSVAKIDEDWTIYVVSGQSVDSSFDPSSSTIRQFELLPEGRIIQSDYQKEDLDKDWLLSDESN